MKVKINTRSGKSFEKDIILCLPQKDNIKEIYVYWSEEYSKNNVCEIITFLLEKAYNTLKLLQNYQFWVNLNKLKSVRYNKNYDNIWKIWINRLYISIDTFIL